MQNTLTVKTSLRPSRLIAGIAIGGLMSLIAQPAAAVAWKAPTKLPTWTCDSGRDFEITGFKTKGDEIHFDETTDGGKKVGWKKMPIWLLGTNFYDSRDRGDGKGVVKVTYDKKAFAGYKALKPGSSYKGLATEKLQGKTRKWDVHITVDRREIISNKFLGSIDTAVVTDRRALRNTTYKGARKTWVSPAHGFVVRWEYKDHRGLQTCEMTALKNAGAS